MRIQRFTSPDMRTAIRMVRESLGPDAVILSNETVAGQVELTAAVDYDAEWLEKGQANAAAPSPASSPVPDAELSQRREAVDNMSAGSFEALLQRESDRQPAPATPPGGEVDIAAMGRELRHLRGLIEHQMSGMAWSNLAERDPLRLGVSRQLMELGFTSTLAEDVVSGLPGNLTDASAAWSCALRDLTARIHVTGDDVLTDGGVVALLGPTGVGKTTTVAKLAARFSLRHGPQNVALITTDNYRIGAHEQLRTFGHIMGIPVRVAHDQGELRDALARFSDRRLVLVDTAGMSQRDIRFSRQVALIRTGSPLVRSYLVLSATTHAAGLAETVRAFADSRPDGCVITKVDEATTLGAAVSVAVEHGIPIAYLSDGQRVPEDIGPARAERLVEQAVALREAASERDVADGNLLGDLTANARF